MIAHRIQVLGRVQGVFFRATTQQLAMSLGLQGWVRNAEDGSVEIHAQGEQGALEKLIQWCHEGPEGADVKEVIVQEAESEDCTDFRIIH